MIKYLSVSIGILFLFSCNQATKMQEVKVKNQYAIDLPDFLSVSTDLNENASLQYKNILKEFYIIIIDESKDEMQKALDNNALQGLYENNLDGYSKLILDNFESNVEVSYQSEKRDTTIHNLKAKLVEYDAISNKVDAYFKYALVEGKSHYYQVLLWTLKDKKNEHSSDMSKIIGTFRELNGAETKQTKEVH